MGAVLETGSAIDVLIAGGGYVGLCTALALKQGAPTLSIAVVDPAPAGAGSRDGRASAIAAAAKRMLETLGIWQQIATTSQPITEMIVTDSRLRDAVRPVFLTFSGSVEDGQPFAHMVPNGALVGALVEACSAAGVELISGDSVADFTTRASSVEAKLASGGTITARLLVAADGAKSRLRDLAGIRTVGWSYGQSGIVTTVQHERPHHGRAEEHFLPAGPFAILPLPGNRSSLVWSEKTEHADRLVKADEFTFQLELERRFGHHLGPIEAIGPKRAYPIGLKLARSFIAPRVALVGDAAHAIHPIAGQGLNLGFKDAAALAETVVDAARLGLDPGTLDILERYERWRRFDTVQMGIVTDGLTRLFSNDNPALRILRDVGLGLVDRLPRLKESFIGAASDVGQAGPRLLRGETI